MRYKVVPTGAGDTVVEIAPTVCRGVVILTAGTAGFSIFDDNATPVNGQKVYGSIASLALGALSPWTDIPCTTGIVLRNTLLGAEVLVVYD
jgi:hypothetical protein